MTARTHDAFAFASLVTVASFYPPESLNLLTLFSAVVATDIGSLLLDLDQAGNRLWDLLPAGDTLGKIFRRLFYKHRTISHSLVGVVIIFFLLGWLILRLLNPQYVDPQIVFIAVMIGYLSHLFSDAMTKESLPLLFPFNINFGILPFAPLRVITGKWVENLVVYPAVWIYLIWFITTKQNSLIKILKLVS